MEYEELVKQIAYWRNKAEYWRKESKRLEEEGSILFNMVCQHPGGLIDDNGGSLHCPLKMEFRRVKPTPPRYDEVYFRWAQELLNDEFDDIDF